MTKATEQRIEAFVSEFIRSEYVQGWTSDKDSDFINEPERAARCYDAAENGADGKTHAEVIEDWREAFQNWVKFDARRNRKHGEYPYRFAEAVEARFDATEAWHDKNGSLYEQIG